MNVNDVRWDDEPPPLPPIQVLSVRAGKPLTVVAAGRAVGVWYHWEDGHAIPCSRQECGCELCQLQRARWKAFMPAFLASGRRVALEITRGCALSVPILRTPAIAGRTVRFERRGTQVNSPLMATVLEHCEDRPAAWFDVRPAVAAAWGLDGPNGDCSAPL